MAENGKVVGVQADLSQLPETTLFPFEQPITVADKQYTSIGFHNYASYQGYAPQGCTAFMGDSYDWWQALPQEQYEAAKQQLADSVCAALAKALPQTVGKAAVTDVATPLTYERYCGTYHGSWMTLMEKGVKMVTYAQVVAGVSALYFAGQRLQTPGVPVAADTGRRAVQYLCRDDGVVFQGHISAVKQG